MIRGRPNYGGHYETVPVKKEYPPLCGHSKLFEMSNSDNKEKFSTFICSSCSGTFFTNIAKWVCSTCPVRQCTKCLPAKEYDSKTCPKGHNLISAVTTKSSDGICSNCCQSFYVSNPHWICNECKFLLCTRCKDNKSKKSEQQGFIRGVDAKGIKVSAEILDTICSFEIELSYMNTTDCVIETSFSLPLDDTMTITGMSAIINGKNLVASIKPKSGGEIKYTDAVSSGDMAYLLTLNENYAELRTGNIFPGEPVKITIKIVKMLYLLDGYWTFVLPTKILEKRIPVSLNLNICSASKIAEIKSISHKIETNQKNDNDALINLAEWNYKDFWVQFKNSQMNLPGILIQQPQGCKEAAVQISFVPSINGTCKAQGEFIFMLDCSGSMSGRPLEMAKAACMMFLKSLPAKSAFNVYTFESDFIKFMKSTGDYTKSNLESVLEKLEKTDSGGGTELYQPLKDVYKNEIRPNMKRFIFILTDGEVYSKEEIIKLIQQIKQ